MPKIEFDDAQIQELAQKLKTYCKDELDIELGGFDAQFFLEFIGNEMGAYFYNQGLYDAQSYVKAKADDVFDAIINLEKPIS